MSLSKNHFVGMAIVCLAVQLYAYRPTDTVSTGRQQSLSAPQGPSIHGKQYFRRMTLDDLSDSAKDRPRGGHFIRNAARAGDEVGERISRKLIPHHSRVRITRIDRDKLGILHVRLSQFHKGLPVVGSDMIVHINKDNAIFAVSGSLSPDLDVDTMKSLTLNSARKTAEQSVRNGMRSPKDSSNLVVFDGRLAYEVLVGSKNSDPELYKCYIDARTGAVLHKQSMIVPAGPSPSGTHEPVSGVQLAGEGGNTVTMTGWHDAGGNYFLYNRDSAWGVYNVYRGDWEQRATNDWGTSDRAAVSLAKNFSIIQSYVRQVDGINSFNNSGAFAQANVHEGTNYVNAYWDGSDFHFGDGDGSTAGPLTVLDVAGHEYGHAITQYTSNLVYSYESGALNESFSDIHGTLVEFWAEPDGRLSYPNKTPGAADWLCGEDCWLSGVALRDLRNPQRFSQPSYYHGTLWYTGSGDNGGVHYNSGVQNFAFYLLSEGGTGTNDGHPYAITGLGIQQAGAIAMYADMYLLTSGAQYRDSRDAWIMAASILGYNATTVADAWTACGVLPQAKHLAATPLSLAYDSVGVGSCDTMTITLSNNGASASIVSGLSFTDTWFSSVSSVPFTVPGGGTYQLKVLCSPTSYTSKSATLTIASNADDNPSIAISLSAKGVMPAGISIEPSSLHATLMAGDSTLQTLQCTNTGNAPLKIKITKTEADTPAAIWAGEQRWDHSASAETGQDLAQTLPAFPHFESAVVTSPLFDGFEQGNYNNWTPAGGSYDRSVTTATAARGRYSFTQIGGSNTHLNGVSATFTVPQQPEVVSFSVRAQSNTLAHAYVVLCGAGNADVIFFFMRHSGNLYVNANQTCPYSANTWYDVKFRLHWANANFDYYVNNVLIASAIPFRNNTPITSIHLYNFHNSQAWWDNINFGGASENEWLKTTVETATIFSGQSLPVPVFFNSTGLSGGTYAGLLSIEHNAPAQVSPLTAPCTLSIRGVRRLSVSPLSYEYGNVMVGAQAPATFTFKNIGTEATRIDSLLFNNTAFGSSATLPLTVRANDSARITAVFQPPSTGAFTGTMTVKSSAEDNPVLTANLSGLGTVAPHAQVFPTALMFGLLSPTTPMSQFATLSNTGGDTLRYSVSCAEVSRPPQGSAGISWLSATPASGKVAGGAGQELSITVNPAGCAAGQWMGRVAIASNDPVNPQVTITATAVVPGCKKLSADKSALNFGTIRIGTDTQLSVVLSNSCNDSVTVSSLTFSNPVFSSNAICPLKVPAFGSLPLSVKFAPTDPGNFSGALVIRSNAEDNPDISLQLSGTSIIPPVLHVSPPSFSEILNPLDSIDRTFTIANLGGDTLSVNLNANFISQPQISGAYFIPDAVQREIQDNTRATVLSGTNDSTRAPVTSKSVNNISSLTNKNVLIIRDNLAWGCDVNVPLLQALGATISIASSSQIPSIDLEPFHCVVIESQQSNSFYIIYRANLSRFDSYVRNGGILEFHSATYSTDRIPNLPFPGGMMTRANFVPAGTNYTLIRSHPITSGADSVVTGNDASHESFESVPAHATILTVNTATQPTTVVYTLGRGLVIATGMTWEIGYAYNWNSGKPFLANALTYSFNSQTGIWLSVSPQSCKVAPGENAFFSILFNAVNRLSGEYAGELSITHNDPNSTNPFSVPCSLTVTTLRCLGKSTDSLKFGEHRVGTTTSLPITFSNSGNDSTIISSVSSDNPSFVFLSPLPFSVPAFGSKTVNISFAPTQAGAKNAVLTVASNAMDNPSLTVILTGNAITPPMISYTPAKFHEILDPGTSVSRMLSISNLGQDTLRFQVSDTMLWLSESATSGMVLPGANSAISITMNSSGIVAGTRTGTIALYHNDPNRASPIAIPCTLEVNAVRHCSVSPATIAFGLVRTGSQASLTVTLSNSGNAATTISAINSGIPEISHTAALPFNIPAFGTATFSVVFRPINSGAVSGTLVIQGNSPDNPVTVPVSGTGVQPPHISITPEKITERLSQGSTLLKTLTVHNSGEDYLHFSGVVIDRTTVALSSVSSKPAANLYDAAHFIANEKGQPDYRVGLPAVWLRGGADAFGYRWKDSDEPYGPTYIWDEISGTGTLLSAVSSCDDCNQQVSLSFSFPFYGTNYSSIYVGSNGYITLGTGSSQYSNYALPSPSAPGNLIAAFWNDLDLRGSGDVYFKDYGDHAVIEFYNVPRYSGGGSMTFQIVLNKNGTIMFYYKSMTGIVTSATVGIQNQNATIGLTMAYNTSYLKNNLAIKIYNSPDWLVLGTNSGVVSPGSSLPVSVTLDATQVSCGSYSGVLRLTHNDPSQTSPLDVPVFLVVSPAGGIKCAGLNIGSSYPNAPLEGSLYRLESVRIGDKTSGLARGLQYCLKLGQ